MRFVNSNEIILERLKDVAKFEEPSGKLPPIATNMVLAGIAGRSAKLNHETYYKLNEVTLKHLRDLVHNSKTGLKGVDELEEIAALLGGLRGKRFRRRVFPSVLIGFWRR